LRPAFKKKEERDSKTRGPHEVCFWTPRHENFSVLDFKRRTQLERPKFRRL